jgi:son of sevenless-like protein
MYDRSLEIEPREREDEKIARYAEQALRDKNSLLFASTVAILR